MMKNVINMRRTGANAILIKKNYKIVIQKTTGMNTLY